jgi:putative integral membrane protein (TIGR02587 family)
VAERPHRQRPPRQRSDQSGYPTALARGFGGAIFFSLPLLMTMEMWRLGFSIDHLRIALLLLLFFPILVGVSHFTGFEETTGWRQDVRDACAAYLVGFVTSIGILWLTSILHFDLSPHEAIGMAALETVPASLGAILAQGQFGQTDDKDRERKPVTYGGELFFMMVGAIFFAFNVAPTEEMILMAFKMNAWHVVGLAVFSLLLMHAVVYAVEFTGQAQAPAGISWWMLFLRWTVVGYAIALVVGAYTLWTFGRFDAMGVAPSVESIIVLGFPASFGAAGARLIL